ncbi:HYR domain-containing protein, partial [Neolewinella lacunae]
MHLALLIFLSGGMMTGLNAQSNIVGCTGTINLEGDGSVRDYIIDPGFTGTLRILVEGGEGGTARVRNEILGEVSFCTGSGGRGNSVEAGFKVATSGAGTLRPGGTLRFILGERGESSTVNGTLSVGKTVGGGGGGSALLYRAPGTSNWTLLLVGGGGGGGTATTGVGFCVATNGGNGVEGNAEGLFGAGGEGNAGGGGGGGGADVNGGGQTCINLNLETNTVLDGGRGGVNGGAGGTDENCLTTEVLNGGFGFGGGGGGSVVGGGGGGYIGGRAGIIAEGPQGRGGGSFWNSTYATSVTEGTMLNPALPGIIINPDGFALIRTFFSSELTCPADQIVYLGPTGTAPLGLTFPGSVTASQTSFDCDDLGNNTVTLSSGTEDCQVSCTFQVRVRDTIPPTASCRPVTLPLNSDGAAVLTINAFDAGSSDNCGAFTRSLSQTTFDCEDALGAPINVTMTVRDPSGNSRSCSAAVTVQDNVAPSISCQSITLPLGGNGSAVIPTGTFNFTLNGIITSSADNCGIFFSSLSKFSFDCADLGPNTVQAGLADVQGNSANCTVTITVVDPIVPTLAANDTTLYLDQNGLAELSIEDFAYALSDNCGAEITNLLRLSPVSSLLNTQGAAAGAGNVEGAKSFPPVLSFTCDDLGNVNLEVEIEAMDGSGNIVLDTIIVTVLDDIAPSITNCTPTAPTVLVNDDCVFAGSPGTFFVSENCPDGLQIRENYFDEAGNLFLSLTFDEQTGGSNLGAGRNLPVGRDSIQLIVFDASGNSDTCSFTIQVEDNTIPVVTCSEFTATFSACPDGVFANSPSGTFSPIGNLSDFSVAAGGIYVASFDLAGCVDDNCSGLEAAFVDSYEENRIAGCSVDIVNVLVIRDAAGNQATDSIFFRSTIAFDGDAPVFTVCPADSLIDCGVVPVVNAADATATSACGTPVVTVSEAVIVGTPNFAGTTYTFTYTATDGCGRMTTCEQIFTVQDTTAPVIICEAIEVALDSTGNVTIENGDAVVSIDDDCGGTISGPFTVGGPTARMFDCLDADSTYQRTVVVTDASGNQGSCTYDVTVIDNITPVIVCEAIEVALDSMGVAMIENADAVVSIYDNCPADLSGPFTVGGPAARTFDCSFADSTFQRTVVITDASGNQGRCTYDVTVIDTIAPIVICEEIVVQLDAAGVGTYCEIELFEATDNCAVNFAPFDQCFVLGCADVGTFEVPITVFDFSGNSSSCTATVTVEDNVPPVAVCQDVTVQLDVSGNGSTTAAVVGNGSSDACGIASLALNVTDFTCANVGPNEVTLTVTDVNG